MTKSGKIYVILTNQPLPRPRGESRILIRIFASHMLHKDLEQLGLSEKEAKVYLAVLELSEADVQEIADKAGTKRPMTYVVLNSLIQKGLCTTFEKNKKAYFVAENPDKLQMMFNIKKRELENQQEQLSKMLEDLRTVYNLQGKEKPFVRFFQGKDGLLSTRNELFEKQGDTLRMLYPLDGFENLYTEAERKEGHLKRNNQKIFAKILYTAVKGNIPNDQSRSGIKIEDFSFPFGADISLWNGKVRIASLNDKMSGVIIEDAEIYKTFVSLYELAWLGAETLKNSLSIYEKVYTRENCLLAFELWEEHQTKAIKPIYNWTTPPTIFNIDEGSAEIYYPLNLPGKYREKIAEKIVADPMFVKNSMQEFSTLLGELENIWKSHLPLKSIEALENFYQQSIRCWCGVDVAYTVPEIGSATLEDKELAMSLRKRSADFLENTDRIFQVTLHQLFPLLGDLVKFLTLNEIKGELPSEKELEKRSGHFIYFSGKIITEVSLSYFSKEHNVEIKVEKPLSASEVHGQVAMQGSVTGKVRILRLKKQIPELEPGEILITSMTTQDYIPAMQKAAAFITDEGGITCHAAITAREFGKPCVIGTKVATQIFKTGDLVEVDAFNGVVRKIKET